MSPRWVRSMQPFQPLDLGCAPCAPGRGQQWPAWDSSRESYGGVLRASPDPHWQLNPLEPTSHLQNFSLIKLHHMCCSGSQFWLRTMKSWVISITFHPQCWLKKEEVRVGPCYTPVCLNAGVCVTGPLYQHSSISSFFALPTEAEILQPCPACFSVLC